VKDRRKWGEWVMMLSLVSKVKEEKDKKKKWESAGNETR
jgi:hypothetical protein